MRIFVRLLAKTCAHLCAFLKNFDVRIFVRLLAKVCAHLSSELLVTLFACKTNYFMILFCPDTVIRSIVTICVLSFLIEDFFI